MKRGGGAHEHDPMRCTFKLTWGCYIFTFLLTVPQLIGKGNGGKEHIIFLESFNRLHKFLSTPLVQ